MSVATITTSVVTGGSQNHATVAEEANAYATDWVSQGVVGTIANTSGVSPSTGGFAVNQDASPDMGVTVTTGVAYVTGTPSGQSSQVLRARMTSNYTTYTINANSSGSTKYDWIYLQFDATKANNPASGADDVITLYTSRSSSNTSDNGTPPTYGIPLAVVTVANGASSITNANITDKRTQSSLSIAASTASTGWAALSTNITAVTYNGNRSYSLTSSADVTGTVSPGMRLRTSRTVAAPTQCASLNGTNNYFSKTSPAGMTFTDDFVVSAWVKLNSYAASGIIASRYNGTSGWKMSVDTSGLIALSGFNASSSNESYVVSYQSLPLNKWVHVTAQLDMSSFTASTTTSYIMFDGVDIPARVARSGTNPTSLVQAGNLEIGSWNGGLLPFNGKIAQVAIFNAKVTQATMRGYISQGLAGTETSLISAYSFNNTLNDLNVSNANNLTNNNSTVITNADSPFGGQAGGTISSTLDYAIVQAISASTITVQVGEGNTIPTTGGVSAVSYSSVKNPYGFPGQKGKWALEYYNKTDAIQASPVSGTWYNPGGLQVTLPIGEWSTSYQTTSGGDRAAAARTDSVLTLSTSNSSETDTRFTKAQCSGNAGVFSAAPYNVSGDLSLPSQTVYYLIGKVNQASMSNLYMFGTAPFGPTIIRAENAYL